MEATRFKIENKTRGRAVSAGVTLVNSAREPLTALRVMVEGLGEGEQRGLWLTQVTVLPMVPRISPFDLVYLDADHCVVQRAELLPSTEIPRFRKPASSALVLPFRTISAAKIEVGDKFICDEISDETCAELAEDCNPEAPPMIQEEVPGIPAALAAQRSVPLAEPDGRLVNPFLAVESPQETTPATKVEEPVVAKPAKSVTKPAKSKEFVLEDYLRSESEAAETVDEQQEQPAEERATVPLRPVKPRMSKPSPPRKRAMKAVPPKPEEPKPATTPQTKKVGVDRFFRWLYPALYDQNRRTSERQNSQGVVAYEFSGDAPRMHEVGNISSQGLYLRTKEPWESGTVLSLSLQPDGPFEPESRDRIDFDYAVVRIDENGVGMSIMLPPGMELKLWEAPGRTGDPSDPYCMVRELRTARALAFMRRICPPADELVTELFHKTLSNVRASNIVEVALRAERLLADEDDAYCRVAHPDLIRRILEHGSWVDIDWLQDLWAGLLASSCTLEGQDDSNLVYINLLSRLSPLPTQILTMACAKATQAMTERVAASPTVVASSATEIAEITRSHNLLKIYKSIGELSELGLVEKNPRSVSPENPGAARALPTQLGLEMFARCNGQRTVTLAA